MCQWPGLKSTDAQPDPKSTAASLDVGHHLKCTRDLKHLQLHTVQTVCLTSNQAANTANTWCEYMRVICKNDDNCQLPGWGATAQS